MIFWCRYDRFELVAADSDKKCPWIRADALGYLWLVRRYKVPKSLVEIRISRSTLVQNFLGRTESHQIYEYL